MVAARQDFLEAGKRADEPHGFVGEWILHRVSGLVDAASVAIHRLLVDETTLHVMLPGAADGSLVLCVELDGAMVDARSNGEGYCVQALLEAETLVWELEQHRAQGDCTRVRRVMRPSKQGSQLIAERVDLNADGGLIGLRTEYWTRTGQGAARVS